MSLGDARVEGIFRDSAWKYFMVHADQRLKLFQFYITLCTALLAAGGLLIRLEEPKVLLVILGVFSVFVSFIFWKLDLRTKTLVKRGEEALKTLDNLHEIPHLDGEGPSPVKLFERDDFLVEKDAFSSPIMGHFSYSKCFNATFLFVGFLGLLATTHGLGLLASAYGIGIGVFKALTSME